MNLEDFENVKNQIGPCGAWCGSCIVGNGALKMITQKYQELINAYGLREWGPKTIDYDAFAEALRSIQSMPSCAGCQEGDGRDNCEIRACAAGRELQSCKECKPGKDCSHPDILNYMRTGARSAGIIFNDDMPDGENNIREWTREIALQWPCSVLFENHG